MNNFSPEHKLVIAIGPEGGWTEQEVELFTKKYGFGVTDCGNRILRTDVAVILYYHK